MPILDIKVWEPHDLARHYITIRSPVFTMLPFGVHSVNVGLFRGATFVHRSIEQYMLIYSKKGAGAVEINNKIIIMEEKTICIFKKGDIIKYYPCNGIDWNLIWIFIEGDACENFYPICYSDGAVLTELMKHKYVDAIIEEMRDNIKSPSQLSDLNNSALMHQLWNIIIEENQAHLFARKEGVGDMKQCIEFMRTNLDKKISVEELSSICHLSKAQFHRLFKKYTGFSPYEYLVRLRVAQCKRQLIETDLSLEDISIKAGFDDASHMIKYFKIHVGLTPIKFKQQYDKI